MLFVCSCELETSNNGDLDGMWHLVRVDTLSTSGVKYMEDDKIYWLFQFKLLQLEDKSDSSSSSSSTIVGLVFFGAGAEKALLPF